MRLIVATRSILIFSFLIFLSGIALGQGIQVAFSSIPKSGTVLVYAHQDDDVIWMLPFWNKTEKFIQGALPTSPIYRSLVSEQQNYLNSNGYNINYESNWVPPWTDITDDEYFWYYWNALPSYSYLALDHIETRLSTDTAPVSKTDIDKMKAKLEEYIASPTVSRIITHDNWGEYGNEHHKGVNRAVRELAVKYKKDVWMLGADGSFNDWPIPNGANIKYTYATYDATLFAGIRNVYFNISSFNHYWTWDNNFIPSGNIKYIQIVEAGIDKSNILTGEAVTTSGPNQNVPGAYIFNGTDNYLTLGGNNNTSFTIAMRVRPLQISAMDISKMTEYPSAPTCDRSFYMQSNGHVTARIFDGQSRTVTSTSALSTGTWTHIVMTSDGSNLKIYVNGAFENSVAAGTSAGNYVSPEFVLGQAQETSSFFRGQMSDVILFDHVLTAGQIATLAGNTGVTYTIAASAGPGGTINPSGTVIVAQGSNPAYTIAANSGFQISDVKVDNISVGAVSNYSFSNVTANHTITATFSIVSTTVLTISGVTANNKVYNGNTAAILNTGSATLVGVLGSDVVTLISSAATGAFSNKNVGTGKQVTTSGFTISGADANKYTITQPLTSANITRAALTVSGVTANNKIYDGTNTATLNTGGASLSGVFGTDVINLSSSGVTGTFVNRNAGSDKPVSITGFTISGADASNYTLTQPVTSANITALALSITGVTANNKVYNGTNAATLNTGSATLVGILGSDVVNLNISGATGSFSSKNVGTGKTVTTSGFTIGGTDSGNYSIVNPSSSANITVAGLTVAGLIVNNKVYNGTTNATLITGSATLIGVFGSDNVNLNSSGAIGTFASKNTGTSITVSTSGFSLGGSGSGNYTLTQPSSDADITAAVLTLTNVIANNKTYDATTTATLNTGSVTLAGVFGTDVVSLLSSGVTGAFVNKNAGTAKTVLISGFTLGGADVSNYTLTQPVTTTANISAVALSISGVTANNKVYNGNNAATLNIGSAVLVGLLGGDVVNLNLSGATGNFSNRNVGTGKTVTTSGFQIGGTDPGNYALISPSLTANITAAGLTVDGLIVNDKVYDGTTDATLNTGGTTLVGIIGSDNVNLVSSSATGTFSDKNTGTGIPVSTSGFSLGGPGAGNYTLTQPSGIADITAATLAVTNVTAHNKAYDGTTTATVNTGGAAIAGVIGTDVVTLQSTGVTGTFMNKNAGTAKPVLISGFTPGGEDVSNYVLTQPATTANISSVPLTISGVTANNKVYNGTTSATLNTGSATLVGIHGTDVVILNSAGATGSFADKNVGAGIAVSTSGFTLGGTDSGNYTLAYPSASSNITAAGLTVAGLIVNNKVYDGTTAATFNTGGATLVGVFGADNVSLVSAGATGTFVNKNAGTGKTVSVSGFSLGGSSSGNYTLTQPSSIANITAAPLTVTDVTAADKIYDGTTAATLNPGTATLSGVFGTDVVTLISSGVTGIFDSKNAGLAKTVFLSGFTLGGADVQNYTLSQTTTMANISAVQLTISGVTAKNKVYNGTVSAALNTASAALLGKLGTDIVNLNSSGATGSFADRNAGTGISVSTSGFTLSGTDSGNYTIKNPSSSANITPAGLTITGLIVNNKVYDGTTVATFNTGSAIFAGVFGTDNVSLVSSGATGTFADKNTGSGKTVSVSGFSLGGTSSGNYTLTQPSSTANITAAALIVTGITAENKIYDRTTAATLNSGSASLSGVFGPDVVTLLSSGITGAFASKNAGTDKTVLISGFTLGGADVSNYSLTQPSTTANINPVHLNIAGVTANNKVYNGTTAAALNTGSATLVGKLGTDVVNLISTGAVGSFADKKVGTGKTVTTSGFLVNGADAGNYNLIQPSLSADIIIKSLTITANDLSKAYGNDLIFTGTEFTGEGLVPGDVIQGITISSPGAQASALPGEYVVSLSGGSDLNYSYTYRDGILIVNKAPLIATADNKIKFYGSSNPSLTILYSGFKNGENASVLDTPPVVSTVVITTSTPGTYDIVLSGGSDNNYDLSLVKGTLEIMKAPLTITAENKTKVYRELNPSLTFSYSGFVLGQDPGVLDVEPVIETVEDINSDAGDYEIKVSGAVGANYSFIYNNGILSVTKANQVINFIKISGTLRMTQKYQLKATSSSELPVSFIITDPGSASIKDNILTVKKDGNVTIKAVQQGNLNWNAAPVITQSIVTLPTFDNIKSLFTPNNDGMNDYWYIPDLGQYGKLEVTVYNRYGQKVYHSDSYKNDWDGTWNGSPLPSASYYYLIKSSEKGFLKGAVNIVR